MQEPQEDDGELVTLARRGGEVGRAAFDRLARRHQAWIIRYLTALVGSQAAGEDVAQDVFVKAWTSLRTLKSGNAFKAWIRVIATSQAFNHVRQRGARRRREEGVAESMPVLAPAPDPGARQAIERAMDELSYIYREVLMLRHVEELAVEEIATTLDIGVSAAKMRLSRATQAFWDAYAQVTA